MLSLLPEPRHAAPSATVSTLADDRPFACDEPGCGRRFRRKFTLSEHRKTHTGEKPYVCPLAECAKRFSTSGNLARHKRLHKCLKPFDCSFGRCARSFPTEDKLRRHLQIHLAERTHECRVAGCHKAFSTAGNLTRHTKHHHPELDPAVYLSPATRFPKPRALSPPSPAVASMDSPSGVDLCAPEVEDDWAASIWAPAAEPGFLSWMGEPRVDEPQDGGRYSLSVLDAVVQFQLAEV